MSYYKHTGQRNESRKIKRRRRSSPSNVRRRKRTPGVGFKSYGFWFPDRFKKKKFKDRGRTDVRTENVFFFWVDYNSVQRGVIFGRMGFFWGLIERNLLRFVSGHD